MYVIDKMREGHWNFCLGPLLGHPPFLKAMSMKSRRQNLSCEFTFHAPCNIHESQPRNPGGGPFLIIPSLFKAHCLIHDSSPRNPGVGFFILGTYTKHPFLVHRSALRNLGSILLSLFKFRAPALFMGRLSEIQWSDFVFSFLLKAPCHIHWLSQHSPGLDLVFLIHTQISCLIHQISPQNRGNGYRPIGTYLRHHAISTGHPR